MSHSVDPHGTCQLDIVNEAKKQALPSLSNFRMHGLKDDLLAVCSAGLKRVGCEMTDLCLPWQIYWRAQLISC